MISKFLLLSCLLVACSHSESGVMVSVGVEHMQQLVQAHHAGHEEHEEDADAQLTTDLGYSVTLTKAQVALASVGLAPCDEHAAIRFFKRHVSLIGTAHAHETGDNTLFEHAYVEDLLAANNTRTELGTFSPPADTYCAVHVALGTSDAPAVALEGTFAPTGETTTDSFSWQTTTDAHFAVPLETPLTLDEDQKTATLTLQWLFGSILNTVVMGEDGQTESKVLSNLSNAARVVLQ